MILTRTIHDIDEDDEDDEDDPNWDEEETPW